MTATEATPSAASVHDNINWSGNTWQLDVTNPLCQVIQNELSTYSHHSGSIRSRLESLKWAVERTQTDVTNDLRAETFDVTQINEMILSRQAAASTVSRLLWAAEKVGCASKV
jgi:hypothetical protein